MSDKKKKAREKAVEMLRDRAMNNGLKNEAQQGARFQKANTPRKETTTSPQTKTTPKTNTSPTTTGKSFQSSVRTSQSPSATQKVFDKTARLTATDKYGDSSARGDGRGRSASATATYRDRHGVTLKTGRDVEKYDSDLVKNRANRSGYTARGAVRQTVGGHLASLGTTAQTIETTARSYNKAKAKYESEANYKLRTREDALRREQDYNNRLGVKEGIDLKNVERRYDLYDPNSLSQKLIRTGDRYIEQGQKDIEKAKEGANGVQRLGVDLGANAIQMAGDRLMAFVPGIGQALAMGSLMNRAGGTASYEARQLGMNPDQQATYQQGTALIEGLSEGIFNSVSAFRSTYGKGAFSLADRVSTSKAAAKIVDRYLKSDMGKALALNLARLGAQGFEEGVEEVVADLAEPALKYALTHSTDEEGYVKSLLTSPFHTEGTVKDSVKNIAYDFLVGALMGAIPGGLEATTGIQSDIQMSKAMRDGKAHADEVIARGLVQQRMGENGRLGNKTNAEVMAERLQQQQAEDIPIQPIQMRVLEEALGESSEANARAFERKGQENEKQAIEQGTLRPSTGTRAEQTAYERGEMALEDRNTETVKETVKEATGKDISENAAMTVGRVVSGTATNDDIDTILTDTETRQAAETVLDRKLSLNNAEARATLEDVITMNEVANKDTLRAEVQKEHAGDIAREVNMSKRGGKLFTENYNEAVDVIGNPSVYEDVFIRLYSDGMIQGSDFNDVYDRVVGSYGGRVADYFTKDVAFKAFNEGRIVMAENKAKSSANIRAKISEGSYGAFVESDAEAYLNEAQRDALDKMAKRGNVTIHIVKSIPILDENGKPKLDSNGKPMSANGYYKNGVITIAADSDNKLITVAKHELTHHIKKISPKRYQELEDFVFKKWYDSDPEKMEDEIRKKQLQYQDITVEEAREEIIADASEAFFTDEGAIHEVMSFSEKLGKAIHDGIHALLDSFIGLDRSQRYAEDGEEGYRYQGYGDFLKDLGILRDAERMWLEALESGMHGEEADSKELTDFLEENNLEKMNQSPKLSLKDAQDNQGNELTEGQKDFFKSSKATDENGHLAVVYHTTDQGGFTVFDPKKSDDKRSLFFASNFDVSQTYSKEGQGKAARPFTFESKSYKNFAEFEKDFQKRWNLHETAVATLNIRVREAKTDKIATNLGKTPEQRFNAWLRLNEENDARSKDYFVDMKHADPRMAWGSENIYTNSLEEVLKELSNDMSNANPTGHYACYLNLENPLVVDGKNANWNKIAVDDVVTNGQQELEKAADKRIISVRMHTSPNYSLDENGNHLYKMLFSVTFEEKDANGKWIRNTSQTAHLRSSSIDSLSEQARKQFADWGYSKKYWGRVTSKMTVQDEYKAEGGYDYLDSNGELIDKTKFIKGKPLGAFSNTRGLSKFAEDNGYDGVIIRNIHDIGGSSHLRRGASSMSDIYVAFNSEQVKLTSNENPTADKDIRYSVKDSDGKTLSKGQQEYFKDSKARDKNGNLKVMYHLSANPGFTVFDSMYSDDGAFYFTDKLSAAKTYAYADAYGGKYAKGKYGPKRMDVDNKDPNYDFYQDIDVPADYDFESPIYRWYESYLNATNPLVIDCKGSYGTSVEYNGKTMATYEWSRYAKENGYDSVIFNNIVDVVHSDKQNKDIKSTVIAVFKPNQIKDTHNTNPTDNEDIRYSVKKAPSMKKLDKSGAVVETSSGNPIAKFETDGSAQFSIRTYDESGRKLLRDYLDNLVENNEFTQEEADNMFNEMETLYSVVKQFANKKDKDGNPLYAPFTAWSYGDIVVGEDGKPVFSAIKKNSEYKMNIDFSTICKKRRTLDNVFRVMINRGLFEKLDLNKDESAALVVNINDLIRSRGFEAACALCFVEARRYRQQQTAQTFTDMWNGLVESMYDDASKISYFNYGEDTTAEDVPDGIHTFSDEDLNLSYLQKLATEKNDKGGLKQTAEAKAARLILRDPSQRKLMRVGDMMASTGFENMQVKNPELMKIYNSKKGTGGAKSSFGDVQYLNEIIGSKTFSRTAAYNVSGVRIQSFSDYVPRMVFDYIQVIGDLAAKKLPAHAYTKEVLFALQFGLTGVKINMSLVPDVVADGIAPGLDRNGNYVWNTDGTFPYEEALKIQEAEGYKENCGTIAVGISDEHIWKMLHDPTIQMVIPYHKSSLNPLVAAMTNVSRFTDYTDFQNTKDANGNTVKKDFDWDNKLYKLSHGKNGKLLPKSEWGDIQELVREYVDWCEERGYTPKFSQFLYAREGDEFDGKIITDENGNKVIDSGYYKMLEDFGLLDNEGNFKPQDDVRMRFPTKESAFGSMESLIKRGLEEDTNLEADRSSKIEGIVDEIETMIDDGSITKQTIFSEALASKMTDADTRFSLKTTDNNVSAQNTIAKLEQNVADLKAEFKRTDLKTADPKDVRVQAGKLLKRHDSNLSMQKDLENTFNKIFRLYKEEGEKAFDKVYEIAKDAAVSVVNNIGFIHDEGAEEYKAIKDYLKTTEITVDDAMKKNITDYEDFRKKNFGRLKLKNGSQSNIDNVYMELSELFPEQFTDDYVNPADQLYHMVDVLDSYKPYYETLDGASEEMQDYVVDIASDIMETAYNLQTKKTFADKKQLEKEAAVKKAREKARESRRKAVARQRKRDKEKLNLVKEEAQKREIEARAKNDKLSAELWKANERVAAERLRAEMDIQRLKQQQAEAREKRRERREDSEARTKLLKIARRLDRLKTTAQNRERIDSLIGELDLVAKGMTEKSLNKLTDLAEWYDDKKANDPDFIADSNIEKKLDRLSKKQIKDMTLEDVRDLYDVLSNIENEIATSKKLIESEIKKEVKEAGRETIANINKSKGINKKLRDLDGFFINGTLSPLRQIRRVTGYVDNDPLYIATKELADGQRKMLDYQMTSWKAFDRFMDDKKFISRLNGKNAEEIEVSGTKDGQPYRVKITPDIRMAMYLASMDNDNLRHMKYGGIKIPDIKLYKKGKIQEAISDGVIVQFTPSQLAEISSHMTKEEKEFAQEAFKYFNVTSPQAINETSEILKGYSIARVENYYPIHTDTNFLAKEFDTLKFDGTIEGMGFLKERVEDSKPIIMTGLIDTLTRSIEMNSKYVGLAIPVRNFGKLFGMKDVAFTEEEQNGELVYKPDYRGSVQDSIVQRWGDSVYNYIAKFMTDIQSGRNNADDWEKTFNKMRSRYAGAVLTMNASVALKQAASYPTAAAVLGRAPLVRAMADVGKVDLDLIAKYTPLQWYRSQGFSTTELGDIKSGSRKTLLESVPALNWIQGMDLMTTRKLWKASEYYVRMKNKNLKVGTDEYYKAVADIYNRVIEETQPNYTTLQRPGLLRSDSSLVQMLNMFKTQPYQNFNIVYDALGNYMAKRTQYRTMKNAATKKALKDATTDLRNAVDSQIMQLAVFAAMTSLWALFRRRDDKYRDEKGNISFDSYLKGLTKDMASNSFAVVPFGSDIYGTVSSAITGEYYYGFTSVTDSSITDFFNSMKDGYTTVGEWIEYAKKDDPEKKPDTDMYKDIEKVAESTGRFLGVPFSNIKNTIDGIYGQVAILKDGEYIGGYEAQKMTLAKDKEKKELLFRAYRNDKKAYEDLRKMMIDDGFEEDKLDAYLKKKIKENPSEEEEANYEKSMDYLKKNNLWKMDSLSKETYEADLRKIALGIADSDTARYTKYENIGITPEENILIRLAMEKVDKTKGNANGYLDAEEKKEAIKLLTSLNLSAKEKEAILGEKWSYKKG